MKITKRGWFAFFAGLFGGLLFYSVAMYRG